MNAETLFPIPPSRNNTCAYTYGAVLLAYILRADCDVYGLLSDDDLELANYAAGYAVAAPDILPIAVDRISTIRHAIAAVQASRKAEASTVPVAAAVPVSLDRPNTGPMAPLQPAPIVRPPAPVRVAVPVAVPDIQF